MRVLGDSVLTVTNYTADSYARITGEFQIINPEALDARMSKQDFEGKWYLPIYTMKGDKIILPRGCLARLKKIVTEPVEVVDRRIAIPVNYTIPLKMEPRWYQIRIAEAMAKVQSGFFIAPCGAGKTNIFIRFISIIKQRTLVIVHTEQLMKQFAERYRAVTGLKPGLFYGKEKSICDVTIGINKSIITHLVGTPMFDTFGAVIVDECDLTPVPTIKKIVNKSKAKYRLGATATYKRFDGQEKMINYLLGQKIVNIGHSDLSHVVDPQIYFVRTGCRPAYYPGYTWDKRNKTWQKKRKEDMAPWEHKIGPLQIKAIRQKSLLKNKSRAGKILSIIIREYNAGEVVLVVCGTRKECNEYRQFLQLKGARAEVIDGTTPVEIREKIIDDVLHRKCRILLGVDVVSRGMDVANISRIIVTVKRETKQIIGRGTRPSPHKKDLKVFEWDQCH